MYILDEKNGQINKNNREKSNFSFGQRDNNFPADFELESFFDKNLDSLPHVLVEGNSIAYILLTELPDKLNDWISTGKTKEDSFRVLSDDKEKEIKAMCRRLKFEVRYGFQKLDYNGHTAEIRYLRIVDPISKRSVALFPWFMLPRKKYPVFVYLFAYWCCRIQNKSEREAAEATKQLFGTEIHFSVISRSLNMAQGLLNIEAPISTSSIDIVPFGDILKCIPEILTSSIDLSQSRQSGDNTEKSAMENITMRFAKMIRPESTQRSTSTPPTPATTRKKHTNETCLEEKSKKPAPKIFVNEKRLTRARKLFIILCRRLVLNAAIQYHKFLI